MNEGSFWLNQIKNPKQDAERARKQAEVEMAAWVRSIIEEDSESEMSDIDSDETIWYLLPETNEEFVAQEADRVQRQANRKARAGTEAKAAAAV